MDRVNSTGTVAAGSGAPTIQDRDWVILGPSMKAGSCTNSVGSLTVTSTVAPAARSRSASSRWRLLFVPATTSPFTRQVTSSSWYLGCCVSTHSTSSGPTSPTGVLASAMALALRRPVIR